GEPDKPKVGVVGHVSQRGTAETAADPSPTAGQGCGLELIGLVPTFALIHRNRSRGQHRGLELLAALLRRGRRRNLLVILWDGRKGWNERLGNPLSPGRKGDQEVQPGRPTNHRPAGLGFHGGSPFPRFGLEAMKWPT